MEMIYHRHRNYFSSGLIYWEDLWCLMGLGKKEEDREARERVLGKVGDIPKDMVVRQKAFNFWEKYGRFCRPIRLSIMELNY